jgi:hypothetical protein
MKQKKEGASLIVVIIIFMFVCTVSISILSMAATNYRARTAESKRIENLYSSESGIDMAYNILGKTFDAAVKYGAWKMDTLKNSDVEKLNSKPNKTYTDDKCLTVKTDIKELVAEIERLNEEIQSYKTQIKKLQEDDTDDYKEIIKLYNKIDKDEADIKKCNKGIERDNEVIDILAKEEFKRAFKVFIQIPVKNDEAGEERFIGDESTDFYTDEVQKSIDGKKYIEGKLTYEEKDNQKKEITADFKDVEVQFPQKTKGSETSKEIKEIPELSVSKLKLKNCLDKDKEVEETKNSDEEKHFETIDVEILKNESFNITIQSDFSPKEYSVKVMQNGRKVQATYEIMVPDFDDVFFGKGKQDTDNYVFFDKSGFIIGGDLKAENIEGLEVTGDIFVQGKEPNLSGNRAYDKYYGGILLGANDKTANKNEGNHKEGIIFNNNVSTRGTFSVQSNVDAVIKGDLSARNLYAGNIDGSSGGGNSDIKLGQAILDNDLTIKGDNVKINMEDFYGINDQNSGIKYDNVKNPYKNSSMPERTSSSIIVNSDKDNSVVKINNSAYIMGVAHIDTANSYQTGESVAVKGNYMAYAVPINDEEKFEYDKPLQLLKGNLAEKSEHFYNYWNKKSNGQVTENADEVGKNIDESAEPRNGGIILPDKVYSVGAVVCTDGTSKNTKVKPASDLLSTKDNEIVNDKRIEYAKRVFKIGKDATIKDYGLGESGADKVKETILKDLSKIPASYNLEEEMNKTGEIAIFNDDPDKKITISKDMSAVIVTNGDVMIDGNVKFTGDIITGGDLIISDKSKAKLEYDQEVVDRVAAKYREVFSSVFEKLIVINNTKEESSKELEALLDVQYDIKQYLKNRLWKLVK